MTVHNHLKSIASDLRESPAALSLAELQKSAGGDLRRTVRNWRMLRGRTWLHGGSLPLRATSSSSKALILEAVGGFAPDEVSRLEKLKKGELVSEAERLGVIQGGCRK